MDLADTLDLVIWGNKGISLGCVRHAGWQSVLEEWTLDSWRCFTLRPSDPARGRVTFKRSVAGAFLHGILSSIPGWSEPLLILWEYELVWLFIPDCEI